jgi:nucleoside-diphosphate-sugar epimerase
MDVLITGATGFIGQKLVSALLERGDGVNYLARQRSNKISSRAAFHPWNGETPPPLNSVPRLNVIVHLMGEPVAQRWTKEVKERILRSRVEGTRQLVSAIGGLRHKPSILISASAVGIYGDRGDELLTETSPAGLRVRPACRLPSHRDCAGTRQWRSASDAHTVSSGSGRPSRRRKTMDVVDSCRRLGSPHSFFDRQRHQWAAKR